MAAANGQKRKRNVLNIAQKIEIVAKLESGVNRNDLMREYRVGSSTIYDIKARKGKLLNFAANSESRSKATRARKNLRKPKLEQLDKVLFDWFMSRRRNGLAVSGPVLIRKAREFKQRMGITEDCVFSNGWLTCFKMRHGIRKFDVAADNKCCEAMSEGRDSIDNLIAIETTSLDPNPISSKQIESSKTTKREPKLDKAPQTVDTRNVQQIDEFDSVGVNIAAKLRSLDYCQRIIAEKLISDIIFHAQLKSLNVNSCVTLNNPSTGQVPSNAPTSNRPELQADALSPIKIKREGCQGDDFDSHFVFLEIKSEAGEEGC